MRFIIIERYGTKPELDMPILMLVSSLPALQQELTIYNPSQICLI